MILTNKLKGEFIANGYTQKEIAYLLGISAKTLSNRLKSGVFKSTEIYKLTKLLNIPNPTEIFFADEFTQETTFKKERRLKDI